MPENPKNYVQAREQKEDAVTVTTKDLQYGADGTTMMGRLALTGGSGKRPAVVIAHGGPGLPDHQRRRADRLAELGYVAFALDYHGGGRFISDRDEMLVGGAYEEREAARCGGPRRPSTPWRDRSDSCLRRTTTSSSGGTWAWLVRRVDRSMLPSPTCSASGKGISPASRR